MVGSKCKHCGGLFETKDPERKYCDLKCEREGILESKSNQRFEMPKFRKKPVIVDAEQFFVDKKPWPKGVLELGDSYSYAGVAIYNGDWLVAGAAYPLSPAIFEQTYEPVPIELNGGKAYDVEDLYKDNGNEVVE